MSVEITVVLNGVPVPLALDDAAIAAIAAAVVPAKGPTSPWLYGAKAAAAYTGLPLGAIQKATAAGVVPCHRLGRRVAYSRDELDEWLATRTGGPA